MTKIAFVTNICPHYRVKTFEELATSYSVDYYFYSEGDEWYWQRQHGKNSGNFHFQNLIGFRAKGVRITPTLPWKLWSKQYDAYIKCINGRFALPITYAIARLKGRPFILWTGIWMRIQTPAHRLFFPFTQYIYQHADAVIAYGDHVKRYLISEGVPAEKIFTTTHAVDNEQYNRTVSIEEQQALRSSLGIGPEQKVVLYVGRLETVKGITYLLRAFASLRRDDAVLVIVGEGSLRSELEAECAQLAVADKVYFTGYVKNQDMRQYYACAYAFVLPSTTTPQGKETWGLVVNEVFNQGIPVIATDAVGAAAGGLVEHGVNGFIVPERNATAIADALRLLLDYPKLQQALSDCAKKKIASWDNKQMVQGFHQAIDYALRSRQKRGC
jgi:glycosyltransferase involved in cell wall biosynthesis